MPPKPRPQRVEQRSALANMQQLEQRSDDELRNETKYRSAAQALLGARAAERYDSQTARKHFQQAIAAARPQERLQLRRMAEASLALAERRPDDLKRAAEKLGQAPPSSRQLLLLRFMGLIAPAPGASLVRRARGVLILVGLVIALLAIGLGIVELIALPFGGVSILGGIFLGLLLVIAVLGVLFLLGRRKQARAKADAASARAARAG